MARGDTSQEALPDHLKDRRDQEGPQWEVEIR
jgi:hypothetical protein